MFRDLVFVHSDVVHLHFGGELRIVDIESGPCATHGDVQDEEEWLVECSHFACGICDVDFLVHEIVNIHFDEFFVPDHLVNMEFADVDFSAASVMVGGGIPVLRMATFVCPVVRAVDDAFVVDGFDDVDFATGGPTDVFDVFAEHPEGGPNAFANGKCNTCFHSAVGEGELVLRKEARGGVFLTFVVFFLRTDVEHAVFHIDVFRAVCVVFQFAVTPAVFARADVVAPFGFVNGVAIEFVAPEEVFIGCGAACRSTSGTGGIFAF